MATDHYTPSADDHVPSWNVPTFSAPALCAETDPEAFFPDKGGSVKDAKRLCGACPAQEECLQWALDNDERFGVWGGLSERERRRLRRTQAARRAAQEPATVVAPHRRPPRTAPRPWTTQEARDAIRALTARGFSAKEIARELGISDRTVHRHRTPRQAAA